MGAEWGLAGCAPCMLAGDSGQGGGEIQPQSCEGGEGGASSEAGRDGHGLQPVLAIMKCKEDLNE